MGPSDSVDGGVEAARQALDTAFAVADQAVADDDRSAIGLFGHGLPETLIAASGARPVHVNFGSPHAEAPMDAVIEPFVDAEVRTFLNRFASGVFDRLRGIVFARDDAAALTAYQYATEWVRQGRATKSPPLFLFNLVHASTAPVATFNRVQLAKLQAFLGDLGFPTPWGAALANAAAVTARRRALLDRLNTQADAATAMRWRNAGRFLMADRHADLLEAALAGLKERRPAAPRLALVGSPIAAPAFYAMLGGIGDLVADLQAFGHQWPGAWEAEHDLDTILAGIAGDPLCPRIAPPQRHRAALVDAIAAAGCDLVICQLAQTDDTFGWEIPGLAAALGTRGIGFVNLGFRDPDPDAAWLATARRTIAAALAGGS